MPAEPTLPSQPPHRRPQVASTALTPPSSPAPASPSPSAALRARGALALQALLVMAGVLLIATVHYHGQTLARGPDQADILLAIFHEASRAIAQDGLWAAMYGEGLRAGSDNWSNPNLHLLYPLYFNWIGADATVFDTLDRLNAIIQLHLAILGAGGFVLARVLGVRVLPALAVGLLLPWFPAVRAAAQWPQIIAGMSWLPWLLAAQAALSVSQGRRDAWLPSIGLALAATLLVYAHPAQNLVFAMLASMALWTSVLLHALWRRDPVTTARLLRQSGWLATASVIVVAATGSYLFEVLRFHAQSIRFLGEYGGTLVGNQPLPVGALLLHALNGGDAGLLVAFEYRRGVGNGYLGAALLAAAVMLPWLRARDALAVPATHGLLACGVIAMLFCFAAFAPLIVHLPLANKVRELIWWSGVATVLLVPLAALSLQWLAARATTLRAWHDPAMWLTGAALIAASIATARLPAHRIEASVLLLVAFACTAWLASGATPRVFPRRIGTVGALRVSPVDLAIVTVLLATVWMPFRHNIEFARDDAMLFKPDRVQARADALALRALLPDADEYRIALGGAFPDGHLLTHSYVTAGFRALLGGIGPDNRDKYALLSTATPSVAALYGLKYTLWTDAESRPGDRRLRKGLMLRTDATALPRLFFVEGGLRAVDDPLAALRASLTPVQAVIATSDLPRDIDAASFSRGAPTLRLPTRTETRATRLRATISSRGAGILVLNEDPTGRWRAHVDGKSVPTLRVNGFQTGVAIATAGPHEVEFERPGPLFGTRH